MSKFYHSLLGLVLITLLTVPVFGQETEPNDTIATANPLTLNVLFDAQLSATDTIDVFQIVTSEENMYSIATQTDPLVFNAKSVLKMDVLDANGVSILNSSPAGRYEKFGCILRGWVPPETGVYYVKIWGTSAALAAVADPSYQMRLWYGTPIADLMAREPDNVPAESDAFGEIATDGTVVHGYLYNDYTEADTFRTNWNDVDQYKVVLAEGDVLIAETFTPGRLYDHPEWIRETDTDLFLYAADGTVLLEGGSGSLDDKDVWAGDPWEEIVGFNNTFSRMVQEMPEGFGGTYYVQVHSFYNTVVRNRNPHESHKNAGGGEYLFSITVTTPDDPSLTAQTLPLNKIKNGSISASDTMDVWGISVESDKMYSIATQTDPEVFNAKSVLKMDVLDASGASILNSSPAGRYEKFGAILRAWVPEESGVYYVKIWGTPAALEAVADPSYTMRLWYGTPLDEAMSHEPDNVPAESDAFGEIATDGTVVHGYLYNDYTEADTFRTNWNDVDQYKVVLAEGDVLIAETFTPGRLYDHPEWIRETDTDLFLYAADGTVLLEGGSGSLDDKDVWAGDPWEEIVGFNNTFSRMVQEMPEGFGGTYYVQVHSFYNTVVRNRNPHESHKNAGGGEYLLTVAIAQPEEAEPNDDVASANPIGLQSIKNATLTATDSVDYFKFRANSESMYTLNTITPRGVDAKEIIKMDLFSSEDPTQSILRGDPATRNKRWGVRVTGWVPPHTGIYYARISGSVTEDLPYAFRLWYGTPLVLAADVHEPDDTIEEAAEFGTFAADGSEEIHSYLYKHYVDSLGNVYNWNDFDLYKIELSAGDSLVAETFTAGPDSCIRDADTKLYLLAEDGSETGMDNDDKFFPGEGNWEELLGPDLSNSFSRIPGDTPTGAMYIPEGSEGTYYIQVVSVYNSILRDKSPEDSDRDPGGGEYILRVDIKKTTGVLAREQIPTVYKLYQSYPNPFNPTTNISYDLPKPSDVKLTIYNSLGQVVKVLVENKQAAGSHSVIWDAMNTAGRSVSTGLYFYKIEAGDFNDVQKMMLMK